MDAVVTDPPYGQTNEGYDSPIAFSPDVWGECLRVCKPNAVLLSLAGNPTYHKIASAIEMAGWRVRQMWAWVYRDGMPISAYPREGFDRLVPTMDPIIYATKGKVLLPLKREGCSWKATRNTAGYSKRARLCATTEADGHYPRTITADNLPGWEYFWHSRTNGYRHERVGHPNQKPIALMKWLLEKLPPDSTVLDPFMGSATTGVAGLDLGQNFIGIEQDQGYLEIARRRIADAQQKIVARDGMFAANGS